MGDFVQLVPVAAELAADAIAVLLEERDAVQAQLTHHALDVAAVARREEHAAVAVASRRRPSQVVCPLLGAAPLETPARPRSRPRRGGAPDE